MLSRDQAIDVLKYCSGDDPRYKRNHLGHNINLKIFCCTCGSKSSACKSKRQLHEKAAARGSDGEPPWEVKWAPCRHKEAIEFMRKAHGFEYVLETDKPRGESHSKRHGQTHSQTHSKGRSNTTKQSLHSRHDDDSHRRRGLGEPRHGESRHGESRHGESRHGESRHGESRHGESRHDSRGPERSSTSRVSSRPGYMHPPSTEASAHDKVQNLWHVESRHSDATPTQSEFAYAASYREMDPSQGNPSGSVYSGMGPDLMPYDSISVRSLGESRYPGGGDQESQAGYMYPPEDVPDYQNYSQYRDGHHRHRG
jgi:hypothetical protein